jgi:hypothetical protein
MDELTIAGKRYISARRAAREHRYHSDYIGQLVRANKVLGQKVGRSWYVEEESLVNYFNGETSVIAPTALDTIPVVEKEEVEVLSVESPVAEEIIHVTPVAEPAEVVDEPIEEKIEEEIAVAQPSLEEEVIHSVPLRFAEVSQEEIESPNTNESGLIYLADDADEEKSHEVTPVAAAVPQVPAATARRSARKYSFVPVVALVVFGAVVFGGSLLMSSHLSATIGVIEGQTAASGFVFQW